MQSPNVQDLYSQIVCPNSYFTIFEQFAPLKSTRIKHTSGDQVTMEITLEQPISFIGVKATNNQEEIFYQPIEVVTLWGHITKTGSTYLLWFVTVLFFGCCCSLLYVRRKSREGYIPIEEV